MTENNGNAKNIRESDYVTVTQTGHVVEIQHMTRHNRKCSIQKIDADRYILLETGEIFEFEKAETRAESEHSLRMTFKRLRYLVNNNFHGNKNELFITLTYAENMTDRERLYKDYEKFIKRLRYKLKLKTADLDYLSVVEPQRRGAWHMHVLLRFNSQKSAYLPSKQLEDIWGHGFVKVRRIEGVDNLGAYLTAYLADIEVPTEFDNLREIEKLQGREIVYKEIEGERKAVVKGGRLWRYPPGMNLYRSSKGVVPPERHEMLYKDIKKVVGSGKPHYRKSFTFEREDFKNTITYEQYNLKRD